MVLKKYTLLIIPFIILVFASCSPESRHTSNDSRKILWFDATANFERFSHPDSIEHYLDKTEAAGVTDIVVDVKPISGEVLYESEVAPRMTEWDGYHRDEGFNYLEYFIREGHERNLTVHASINVMGAGHNFYDRGLVYEDKSDWQTVNYTPDGFKPITEFEEKYSAMLNPVREDVQNFNLNIIRELASEYNLDGIILDRVRYDGIMADFTELSREAFESYIGKNIENWPEDIYEWDTNAEEPERIEGPLFNEWLEWRTSVIYNFMKQARETAKEADPDIIFGNYTGAWYPVYYEVGVNYASREYDPSEDYEWATSDYKNYGLADLMDLFTTGNYFYEVTTEEVQKLEEDPERREAGMGETLDYWYSVEGSAQITNEVVKGAVPTFSGLYVEQYHEDPEQFKRAVEMCLQESDGLMIFDIVHIINYGWWKELEDGINSSEF